MKENDLTYEEIEINTADILVPRNSYQRGLSVSRAKRIADHFAERIANKPKVSYRDGTRDRTSRSLTIEIHCCKQREFHQVILCI